MNFTLWYCSVAIFSTRSASRLASLFLSLYDSCYHSDYDDGLNITAKDFNFVLLAQR